MVKQLNSTLPNNLNFWENWLFIMVSKQELLSSILARNKICCNGIIKHFHQFGCEM